MRFLFSDDSKKLEEYHGNLPRAAVELAKEWRTDRSLRHLEALLVVADAKNNFLLSGNGDVIEPDDGIIRHRLGRLLRAGGGARSFQEHQDGRKGDLAGSHAHRQRNLHFHQCNFSIEEL